VKLLGELRREIGASLERAGKFPGEAALLLQAVTGIDSLGQLLAPDTPLLPGQSRKLTRLLRLRLSGEPLQWLLGETEFFGLRLQVCRGVLIPRPETEQLVDWALRSWQPGWSRVADVGTGSGAVALALAAQHPEVALWASDLNPRALRLARRNARRLGLQISFKLGDLLVSIPKGLDLIVANLPYLPLGAPLPEEVRREPAAALFGGSDGLALIRPLIVQARTWLRPGGALMIELDPSGVAPLLQELAGSAALEMRRDLNGTPRFLKIRFVEDRF
jgi:release factor glutamine methyltransferase